MDRLIKPTMLSNLLGVRMPKSSAFDLIEKTKLSLGKPKDGVLLVSEFLNYHKIDRKVDAEEVQNCTRLAKADIDLEQLIIESKRKAEEELHLVRGKLYRVSYRLLRGIETEEGGFDGFTESGISATFIRSEMDVFSRVVPVRVGFTRDGELCQTDHPTFDKEHRTTLLQIELSCKSFTIPVISIVEVQLIKI